MKRDTINYALVGGIVMLAFALLLGTLLVLTGQNGRQVSYYTYFDNVTGLRLGAPVLYQGFRIGQVKAVRPEREKMLRYRVELSVERDWPIPADSVAQLQASGILADVRVAIRGGESGQMLSPDTQMASEPGGDVFTAMNALADELTLLTRDRIRPLVESLALRLDSISGAIDSGVPALVSDGRSLLTRLNQAADNINRLTDTTNQQAVAASLQDLQQMMAELRETQTQTRALIETMQATLGENRPEIRQIVLDMEQVVGTLAQRMDAVAHHLDSSSRNFDAFSREIRRNPRRLLFSQSADEVDAQ